MTSQVFAAELIADSVSAASAVVVTPGDAYAAGCEWDALMGALLFECDGDIEDGCVRAFWGAKDGHEWRVCACEKRTT